MIRRVSNTVIWVAIFMILVVVQAYNAFGQESDIVGKWKDGNVGLIQYQNQVTGATKSGRSHLFTYNFLPNGNYEFIGYMEMNMYNCSNTLFNQIAGKYTVEGSTIYLNPAKDFWKSTNSCAASGNKQTTKVPVKKTLEYELKEDDYGKPVLCLADGDSQTCFSRDKE